MSNDREAVKAEYTAHTIRALKNLSITDLDAFAEDYAIMRAMMRRFDWLADPFHAVFDWARQHYVKLDPPEPPPSEVKKVLQAKLRSFKEPRFPASKYLWAAEQRPGRSRTGLVFIELRAFSTKRELRSWIADSVNLRVRISNAKASNLRHRLVRSGNLLVWRRV